MIESRLLAMEIQSIEVIVYYELRMRETNWRTLAASEFRGEV